ncbi:MAG: hypothetical protein P9M14_18255 [Candidatus Alcyoniella australis]|nr:hypothetical protein [Candidatus Alcyoniella australis]
MVETTMQALAFSCKQVEDGNIDLPRELLRVAEERLMSVEADTI